VSALLLDALTKIRDSTFRDAASLRAIADDTINRFKAGDATPPAGAGEVVAFLADGRRFKLAQSRNGSSFDGFPAELAGRWVALVDATDGKHIAAPTPLPDAVRESALRLLALSRGNDDAR
jgi:hypothetical protein